MRVRRTATSKASSARQNGKQGWQCNAQRNIKRQATARSYSESWLEIKKTGGKKSMLRNPMIHLAYQMGLILTGTRLNAKFKTVTDVSNVRVWTPNYSAASGVSDGWGVAVVAWRRWSGWKGWRRWKHDRIIATMAGGGKAAPAGGTGGRDSLVIASSPRGRFVPCLFFFPV